LSRNQYTYFYPLRVRYNETSAQGSVFYSNHLVYFDLALTELCNEAGYDYTAEHESPSSTNDIHAVRATLDLHDQLYFDQHFEIAIRIGKLGRSSVTFELATFQKDQDKVLVKGEIVWVFVDKTTHKSTPIPQRFMDMVVSNHQPAGV